MPHRVLTRAGANLHIQLDGPQSCDAPTVVFANALGTTLSIWDGVLPHLPDTLRVIRYDMRGHGKSDVPDPPYTMGAMVADAEAICDALDVRAALFVGLSVGGMVAQGLAVKRPDLIRAMVLSNTAARIGNAKLWHDRIGAVQTQGLPALADGVVARWSAPAFRASPGAIRWRDMLAGIDPHGYAGVCAAIAGTDFYTPTSGLRLPVLGIAGAQDRATPPDLVRETIDLIPGSQFTLMRHCGHLPCVEDPTGFAAILSGFMTATGHLLTTPLAKGAASGKPDA